MRLIDCYKILSVQEDSSDSQVRSAYRKKAKLVHPDKHLYQDASSKFNQLNEAYRNIVTHRKKLNKIKLSLFNQMQKREKKIIDSTNSLHKQYSHSFEDHMKTLDFIEEKLKSMRFSGSMQSIKPFKDIFS